MAGDLQNTRQEIENSEHINTKYDIEDATQIQKRERGRLDTQLADCYIVQNPRH